MKFVKFDQATSEILVPNVGPIPFYIEGKTTVICVELDRDEIKELTKNGGRIYILGPCAPFADHPIFINPQIKNPFIKPQNNGKNNGAPSQG